VRGTGSRKDRGGAGPERHRPEDRLQLEPEERGGDPQRLVVERAGNIPRKKLKANTCGPRTTGHTVHATEARRSRTYSATARARTGNAVRQNAPAAAARKPAGNTSNGKKAA
jgi:hypothetical protein